MQEAIKRQKEMIRDKEAKIEAKNKELEDLQETNKQQLDALNQQYEEEMARKHDLDNKLAKVKQDLSNIENTFPTELTNLKNRINQAKQETLEYEKKTNDLAQQLRELKAKASEENTGGAAQQVP